MINTNKPQRFVGRAWKAIKRFILPCRNLVGEGVRTEGELLWR